MNHPPRHTQRLALPLSLALGGLLWGLCAQASPDALRDADLKLGEKLIQEHRCTEGHVGKVGGDGSAIYRPQGRVNSIAALVTMVDRCNTELSLHLFPEDVSAVAAVLNRDHYRLKR